MAPGLDNAVMRLRPLLLAVICAVFCRTAFAAEERRNWFGDPFAQATKGLQNCPVPDGPLMTEKDMRMEAHSRSERGTRCWQEKKCDSPNAYKYDKPINDNVTTRLSGDPRFKDSTVWVRTLRGFVFLQGCIKSQKQREQMLGAVGALPRVERVVDELQLGVRAKPPYKVAPK
jgi:hypothetical protein